MESRFGDIFLFLTDLAWKSRLTIPVLVTTAFLVMDIRLQIEINIQTGQVNASDLDEPEVEFEAMRAQPSEDEGSEGYSEFTSGEVNSSDESRYSLYDDMSSEYDVDDDPDAYYPSELPF
ncbi:uncharacterized protein LOC108601865 [Drosophila busckii]|uniref:uncharacterized protein LOC108601865 n=1 Tax=Drosophila busckii TaxID=30019 RepID=UPI00083EFF2C|nr:uncharacterized protein LOC108601865 [Drosophila busckii]